jgi:hypothetical protein
MIAAGTLAALPEGKSSRLYHSAFIAPKALFP